MNVLKLIGWFALGTIVLGGAIGGALYWQHRQRKRAADGPTPSNPPRDTSNKTNGDTPARHPSDPPRNQAQCRTLRREEIGSALIEDIEAMFGNPWPQATPEAVDKLETGDVIVFGVESKPTEDFEHPQQELISASVLSVEKTHVRGRVIHPVEHADHHGNSAGHGLYVGALVEVPREHVMLVARLNPDPELPKSGYGSKGDPARVFKPTNNTGQAYKVHPSTVYDLDLPYRTDDLVWIPSRENVKYYQIGDKGLRHQIMFTEASVRGPYSITVLDDDEKEGNVFVGKWDFVIAE
jgi:hypothetical protein